MVRPKECTPLIFKVACK